jgi:hypothetical protein
VGKLGRREFLKGLRDVGIGIWATRFVKEPEERPCVPLPLVKEPELKQVEVDPEVEDQLAEAMVDVVLVTGDWSSGSGYWPLFVADPAAELPDYSMIGVAVVPDGYVPQPCPADCKADQCTDCWQVCQDRHLTETAPAEDFGTGEVYDLLLAGGDRRVRLWDDKLPIWLQCQRTGCPTEYEDPYELPCETCRLFVRKLPPAVHNPEGLADHLRYGCEPGEEQCEDELCCPSTCILGDVCDVLAGEPT